ncbi:MAG: proteobacterial sortase system peptidoglycan-associated [Circular genetic element sp.]|nr:MAG: proteobacterial sortase system peptidoglycan-associated [Circular genetic element sp.]
MPRMPVDGEKVIEHRITLGGKERQLLDEFTTAYQVKNIGGTVVQAIATPAVGALIISGIVLFLNRYLEPDWKEITKEMTPDQLRDWLETQNLVGYGLGAIIGGLIAGPFGALFGVAAGGVAVEGVEAGLEIGADIIEKTVPTPVIFAFLLELVKLEDRIPFI